MPQPLDPRTHLCHYVKLRYFPGMIDRQAFTATRLDVWHRNDFLEGRYNANDQARLDAESIEALEYIGTPPEECEKTVRFVREHDISTRFRCPFVVCFRKDDHERDECWDQYFKGEPGLMLRTTAEALDKSLKMEVFFQKIAYLDHEVDSAVDRGLPSFFCKHKGFEWEQEVRMIRYVSPLFDEQGNAFDCSSVIKDHYLKYGLNEGVKQFMKALEDKGFTHDPLRNPERLPIEMDFTDLFSEVVLSPGMSKEDEALVRYVVSVGKLNTDIRRAESRQPTMSLQSNCS